MVRQIALRGNARKEFMIESLLGKEWRTLYPDKSIDWVFTNRVINDDRTSFYCKITKEHKNKLHEMLNHYDTATGELFGIMIDSFYELYLERKDKEISDMADNYSG